MVELADPQEEDAGNPGEEGASSGGGSKKGLLLGAIGAALLGAGAFYAVYSGLLFGAEAVKTAEKPKPAASTAGAVFVPMDPIVITLGPRANARSVQLTAQLEVAESEAEKIAEQMPRVRDVLNTYLRALEERDLDAPGALIRIRAQMLRRVRLVTGPDAVRDLLISDFLLN